MPHTQKPAPSGRRGRKPPASRGLSPLDQLRLDRLYRLRELKRRQAAAARVKNADKWATPGAMAAALDPSTIQTAALDEIDAALLDVAEGRCKRLIITMPPQEGKALALDTPIATPSGWTTMGALRVGDQVFDRYGQPCNVTWVSPVWTDRPCYEVRTGDGEAIVADAAHEWVARLDRRRGEHTYETTDLARARTKNAQITGPAGLDLPDADLPLDPYVLGAWLGDGHARGAMITCADEEIADRIRAAGVPCRKGKARYLWTLAPEGGSSLASPVRRALDALGVWGNKHVPDAYMRGSRAQRLALLQGLIDTDGYVSPKGQVEFVAANERLARDVRDLVFTLGAKATIAEGRATINGRDCGPKWRVKFYLADAAHLPRKAARCKDSSVARVRYVSAVPTASVPVRCIEVDSPTHTYLAGRTLLPTHNSQRVSRRFPLWLLVRRPSARIVLVGYELGIARRWGRTIKNDIATHGDVLGLSVRDDTSAAHEWQLAGDEGGVYCVGIGGALTGRPADVMIIDDPHKGRKDADSLLMRENVWDWWTETARTRFGTETPVVLVQTRWHEDDLAGRLLEHDRGSWRVINIPAQADHKPEQGESDPLGRAPGDFLESTRGRHISRPIGKCPKHPAGIERADGSRRECCDWDDIRHDVGSRGWQALYQGNPTPSAGVIFNKTWWQRYEQPQWTDRADGSRWAIGFDELIISVDCTFKDSEGSDYVAMQVWGRRGLEAYLLDQVYDRMTFVETCDALRELAARWPQALLKLVEDTANGPAVINSLARKVPGLVPVTPDGSKVARAAAVSPFVEGRGVWLPAPELCPWVGDLIAEAAQFPQSPHDDRVDAMTQALNRLLLNPLLAEEQVIEDDEDGDPEGSISPY